MSERTNFKLAYGGATHKFASTYQGEELLKAVKAKVSSVVDDEAAELCWIDDESSCVLDTVADLQTAIEFAKFTRKSDSACPCISLVIVGTEEEMAAVAERAAPAAAAAVVVETPVTGEQVKYAIEKAEGVDEDDDGWEELLFRIPLNNSDTLGVSLKARVSVKHDRSRHDCGIFVKKVLPGGAAYRDGRLRENDRVVAIEDECVRTRTNAEASEAITSKLRQIGPDASAVTLRVWRPLSREGEAAVMVETPITEEQVKYAIEKAEGVDEDQDEEEEDENGEEEVLRKMINTQNKMNVADKSIMAILQKMQQQGLASKGVEKSESSDESSSDEEHSEDSDEDSDEAENPQLGVGIQALMRHLSQAQHQMQAAENRREMSTNDDEEEEVDEDEEESEEESEFESDSEDEKGTADEVKPKFLNYFNKNMGKLRAMNENEEEEEETDMALMRARAEQTDCVKTGDDEEELDHDVTQESDDDDEEDETKEKEEEKEQLEVDVTQQHSENEDEAVVEQKKKKKRVVVEQGTDAAPSINFWTAMTRGFAAIVPPPIAPPLTPVKMPKMNDEAAPRLITEDMVASLRKGLDEAVFKMEKESDERMLKEKLADVSNKVEEWKGRGEKRESTSVMMNDQVKKQKVYVEVRDAALDLSIALAAAEQTSAPSAEKMAEYARLCASGLLLKAKYFKEIEAEKREKDLKTREAALALKEEAFVKKVAEFAVKLEDVEEMLKRVEERVDKVEKDEKMERLEQRLDAMEERLAKVEEQMDDEDIVYM